MAAFAVLALFLGAGCATSGRHVLLKEYGPSLPPRPDTPLQNTTICIKPFQCVESLSSLIPTSEPAQLPTFRFVPFTDEQSKTWAKESKLAKQNSSKADWREIGNVRNALGIVMSHVYALNDPGVWLADTLKMDLESLGAKVVGANQEDIADITLSGTLHFCRVDIFVKIWGDLAVDIELQSKGRSASHMFLHTDGGTVGWVGSSPEFYRPLRECRQKISWLVSQEILEALKSPVAVISASFQDR